MNLQVLLLSAMMTFGAMPAHAQQDSVKRYQKIEQLFGVMNMESLCLQAANTSADQTIANTPQLAGKKEEARAFFIKYMGYAASKDGLTKLYAKYYTPEEIEELIKFYKTSAGKKSNIIGATIQAESLALTTQNLQAHSSELNQLVNARDTTNKQ